MMMRFKETEVLKKWLYKQENIPIKVKKPKMRVMSLREDNTEIRSELEENEALSDSEEDFPEQKCDDWLQETAKQSSTLIITHKTII